MSPPQHQQKKPCTLQCIDCYSLEGNELPTTSTTPSANLLLFSLPFELRAGEHRGKSRSQAKADAYL